MKSLDPVREFFAKMIEAIPERSYTIIPEKDGDYSFPSEKNSWASPYIEIQGDSYLYIINERGHILNQKETSDLREICFWVCREYTLWIASRYELRHRIEAEDSRRQWMALHVQLLNRFDPQWGKIEEDRFNEILSRHPFHDSGDARIVQPFKYSFTKTEQDAGANG